MLQWMAITPKAIVSCSSLATFAAAASGELPLPPWMSASVAVIALAILFYNTNSTQPKILREQAASHERNVAVIVQGHRDDMNQLCSTLARSMGANDRDRDGDKK